MIIKEEGLLICLSTSSKPSVKKGLHLIIKEEPLDFFVVQFLNQYEERTSHDDQRGRPLDFFVDQFITKYEERTSQDNQRGRPFDFFVDHFLTKCEVRTIRESKDEGLLIFLSTSSKPSMK